MSSTGALDASGGMAATKEYFAFPAELLLPMNSWTFIYVQQFWDGSRL
jgi:hypothetical protein